jgi:AraC-like DNA-binding protein
MATSQTMGEAIDILTEFGRYINLLGNLYKEYQVKQHTFSLILSPTPADAITQALEAETTFASLLTLFKHIVDDKFQFARVDFTHASTNIDVRRYSDLFGGDVFFSQKNNCITLPTCLLQKKLAHGNSTHAQVIRELCRTGMEAQLSQQDFLSGVTEFITNHATGFPTIKQTADHFMLSVRSLHRRLSDTGTSFQLIINNIKYQAACRYLVSTQLTVYTIAQLLGYSEAKSFRAAFKRWTGLTPAAYRQNKQPHQANHLGLE